MTPNKKGEQSLPNVQRITKEIMYIKKYVTEDLPIFAEVNRYISDSNKNSLVGTAFYNLNLKLFIDASEALCAQLESKVNKIRLAPTKEYWADINEAKSVIKELTGINQATKEHVESARTLFGNLVQTKKDLIASQQDIKSEGQRKFIQYYGIVQTVITITFFGFTTILGNFATQNFVIILIAYIYLATIVFFGLRRYFMMGN